MTMLRGAERILYSAIENKNPFVEVQVHGNLRTMLSGIADKDPRITAFVCGASWRGSSERGMAGLIAGTRYSLTLEYYQDAPKLLNDVLVDNGTWLPSDYVKALSDLPDEVTLVTKDPNGLWKRCADDRENVFRLAAGVRMLRSIHTESAIGKGWHVLRIVFDYGMPLSKFRQLNEAAEQKVLMLLPRFGDGTVPKYVKVFLVFSYLQTVCSYDAPTAKCIEESRSEDVRNQGSLIAYGPLVQNLGICTGFAEAFQLFMDKMGVEGRLIRGVAGTGDDMHEHSWNLVELGGRWYHVDVTCGIDSAEVCVQKFMKTDAEMLATHSWDRTPGVYPSANGNYYTMDRICDYIEDHESELLALGIDRRFLLPTLLM